MVKQIINNPQAKGYFTITNENGPPEYPDLYSTVFWVANKTVTLSGIHGQKSLKEGDTVPLGCHIDIDDIYHSQYNREGRIEPAYPLLEDEVWEFLKGNNLPQTTAAPVYQQPVFESSNQTSPGFTLRITTFIVGSIIIIVFCIALQIPELIYAVLLLWATTIYLAYRYT